MLNAIISVVVATIPIFFITLVGVFLRRKKIVGNEVDKGLTTLLINVLVPCFILSNVLGSDVASDLPKVVTLASIGAFIIILSIALIYSFSPLLGMREGNGRRSFTVASSIQNYGFMVVPLILSLYGDKELLAALFLHNLGVEIAMYSIAIMVFSGKFTFHPKVFLKAPIIAVIIGVVLNTTQWVEHLPLSLLNTIELIGAASIPMALIAIGMTLGEVLPQSKFSLKVSSLAILVRLIILPIFILAIAYFLPLDSNTKKILLLQSAMPAALLPIVLARHYGGQPSLVGEVIIASSAASFITMPIVITLGSKLLNI